MTDVTITGQERSGVGLFNLFGIEIRLDWSVLIIFGLIVYSLGTGLFPQWHPDWSAGTAWLTALAAGVIFFVSLLAHELAHSLMARRYGIRVPRITLFLFGGMAEMEAEARTPKQEFFIAVVGPLTSLILGALFTGAAMLAMDDRVASALTEDPQAALSGMSPWITAFLWLGSVNVMLAVFNMVPGFPLDGGRVFRALVWWLTGDPVRATRLASNAGRLVGWLIIAYGFWNVLALGNLGGLWLVFIGWFLTHLARVSYSQLMTERSLRSVRVQDVMRTRFDSVPAEASLEDFIENYLLRSSQHLWPVTEDERFVGTIAFSDVTRVPTAERRARRVRDLLTPLDERHCLAADEMASSALRRLAGLGDQPVVVVQNGRVVGLLRAGDILRWTMVHRAGQ